MPAVITDQFRISNAETFVQSFVGVGTTANYYYTFLAHPNPQGLYNEVENYGTDTWNTIPPSPKDSFEQENSYHDSMLFLKKVGVEDVTRIIPRYDWQNGSTYDMYKHNYDINNPTSQLNSKTLYEGKYVVVNSEYKVYLCINNGSEPENEKGQKSLVEPNFVSTIPQAASVNAQDGYLWKYLYTISPAEVIKFATDDYIPLPKNWGDPSTITVKNAAVDGGLQTIVITNRGSNYQLSDGTTIRVPVYGNGSGGEATITIANGEVSTAEITSSGTGYTRAFIRVQSGVKGLNTDASGDAIEATSGTGATFEVPCPPKGGHGDDIYRELGAHRIMVYSKYDNDPDYIIGNNFARVGIIKNPTIYGSDTVRLNTGNATALGALKLVTPATTSTDNYKVNTKITQTVGVGSTAVAYVGAYSRVTNVLRYFQPAGLSTSATYGYKVLPFSNAVGVNTSIIPSAGPTLPLDTSYTGSSETISGKVIQYGQQFTNGIAPPDIQKYSGEIIYVDNRAPITRSTSQKEELKIVVEF